MSKYLELYDHYKKLILSGMLLPGTRLPSVRRCSQEFSLSRTTVETAYGLLAAEGYILSKPQSGYFVCDLLLNEPKNKNSFSSEKIEQQKKTLYDLVTVSADKESFDFALWRRYVKSALRQDERLLSYGQSNGEADLRAAIARYIAAQRGVVCSPESIVVSAGTQGLLSILCVLLKEEKRIAFLGLDFPKGRTVFEDYGKEAINISNGFDEDELRQSGVSLLYVSPSYVDSFGSVLSMSERARIIEYARRENCIVIEDDYGSEFRYGNHPVMSLQGLDGGENVVYIGTFSRLLLPSIRVGFMVLPPHLSRVYKQRAALYNQTASKAEQIALCQYITDGHLLSRIKRQRKNYTQKSERLCELGNELLFGVAVFSRCEAAYLIKARSLLSQNSQAVAKAALAHSIKVRQIENEPGTVLLSCAGFDMSKAEDMLLRLKKAFELC